MHQTFESNLGQGEGKTDLRMIAVLYLCPGENICMYTLMLLSFLSEYLMNM